MNRTRDDAYDEAREVIGNVLWEYDTKIFHDTFDDIRDAISKLKEVKDREESLTELWIKERKEKNHNLGLAEWAYEKGKKEHEIS